MVASLSAQVEEKSAVLVVAVVANYDSRVEEGLDDFGDADLEDIVDALAVSAGEIAEVVAGYEVVFGTADIGVVAMAVVVERQLVRPLEDCRLAG